MEGGESVATATAVPQGIVDVRADEIARNVDRAVGYWISQIDEALNDANLTSLGRRYAAKEIVERYQSVTGKPGLEPRRA